jgi:hypothetical protein
LVDLEVGLAAGLVVDPVEAPEGCSGLAMAVLGYIALVVEHKDLLVEQPSEVVEQGVENTVEALEKEHIYSLGAHQREEHYKVKPPVESWQAVKVAQLVEPVMRFADCTHSQQMRMAWLAAGNCLVALLMEN